MTQTVDPQSLARAGVIAVIRAPAADLAVGAVEALLAGGVTGIEITYSTPGAASVIERLADRHGDGILLGAGTITTPDQAREAAAAGARFLVSPGHEPRVSEAMAATGRSILLGALTPTEVMAVLGLDPLAVKIFPASLGGPAYLRALRGPFPDVPLMPTGGVTPDNVADWVAAGVVAVGAGSDLCSAADLRDRRWDAVEEKARRFTAAWRAATAGGR